MKSTRILAALGLGLLVMTSGMSGARAQEEEPAVVTVFHAVPAADGFPADVYLNGDLIIDGFVFETSSAPFQVPPGSATLEIYPDGSDPDADSPTVSTPVTLSPSTNYSVVAQIAEGAPVISIFENNTSGVGPGDARVTFRQTSSLPRLNVSLDGVDTFTGVASTNEATIDRSAGVVQLEIDNGTDTLVDQQVTLGDGELTILYAVGDPARSSFEVLVQEVILPQVSPTGVPTGSGGHRAAEDGTALLIPCLVVTVLGLAMGVRRVLA